MPATSHRLGDPEPLETRVEIAVALLDRAAAELRRLLEEIKAEGKAPDDDRTA